MRPNLHLAAPLPRMHPSWVPLLDRSSSRTLGRTRFPMKPQRLNSHEAQSTNLQSSLPATRGCLRLYCSILDRPKSVLSMRRAPMLAEPFTTCLQIAELAGIPAVAGGSNFVFSPLSLVAVLSLTASGARGETLRELLSFLGSPNLEHLHSASVHLAHTVSAGDRELILSFVKGAWVDRSMAVNPSFVEVAASVYGASIEPVDFIHQGNIERLCTCRIRAPANPVLNFWCLCIYILYGFLSSSNNTRGLACIWFSMRKQLHIISLYNQFKSIHWKLWSCAKRLLFLIVISCIFACLEKFGVGLCYLYIQSNFSFYIYGILLQFSLYSLGVGFLHDI